MVPMNTQGRRLTFEKGGGHIYCRVVHPASWSIETILYIYCDKWKLTVNTSKTKVVVFSRGKVRNIPKWRFGPEEVETTPEYTYLGIKFNYNGSFEKAMSKQVNQAKRALYSLVSKFRKLNLPYDIQCHLIDSCIIPILLYGSEVWGSSNLKQIETCHNQTCNLCFIFTNVLQTAWL